MLVASAIFAVSFGAHDDVGVAPPGHSTARRIDVPSVGEVVKAFVRKPEWVDGEVNPCWWTCSTDTCAATMTHPLTNNMNSPFRYKLTYYTGPQTKQLGCCAYAAGQCSQCCLDVDKLTTNLWMDGLEDREERAVFDSWWDSRA